MQYMMRWQVEAVKSEITGAVYAFRIMTLRWKRKNVNADWDKVIPDEVEADYDLYSQSLDELTKKEYIKILKLNFIKASESMDTIASAFIYPKREDQIMSHTAGLNWIECVYEYDGEEDYL